MIHTITLKRHGPDFIQKASYIRVLTLVFSTKILLLLLNREKSTVRIPVTACTYDF